MNKNVIKRIICCFVFLLIVIPQVNSYGAESVHTLKGPERSKDEKKVTWDCVWYGSYPQSEIKQSNAVYKKLAACKEWNEDNDATIDGTKYRRVENSKEESGYKYYVYEPIKWRVLDVQGDMVTLLSNKVIEMEKFENGKIFNYSTWRGSSVRDYLNSICYKSENRGYDGKGFLYNAFTKNERNAICKTKVYTKDIFFDTNNGLVSSDKVFLLSEAEVYATDTAVKYGFDKEVRQNATRIANYTDYAGCGIRDQDYGNDWILRNTGSNFTYCSTVNYDGKVAVNLYEKRENWESDDYYASLKNQKSGIRPAMNVKISSAKTMTYAGKINNNNEYSKIPVKPVKVKGNKEKTPSKVMSGNETKITKPILDGYIYEKDGITYRAKKIRDSYEWETPLDLTAWYMCLEVVKIPDKASVKIPDKLKIGEKKYPVSFIGKKAAYGNKNLKKIVFSNHIVMVDKYAFANCENLETVVTGQNTKTVYEYGFYNCKSLKSITFQTGYVDLYKKAFYNCKSLKKVIFTYETKSNVKANKKYWDKNKVFTKTKAKFIIKDQKK